MSYDTLIDLLRTAKALRTGGTLGGARWTRETAIETASIYLAARLTDAAIRDAAALLVIALEESHAAR